MPPKRNLKKRSLVAKFYFGFAVNIFTRSGTYVCVNKHKFSEIKQSTAKLWWFKWFKIAPVHHLVLWKKAYLDHFACCGTPLSTYAPNLMKISWPAAEIYHHNWMHKNAPIQQNSTSSSNFDTLSPAGTFVCVIMLNFSQIGWSVAELYRFYHFTLWGIFSPSPSMGGSSGPQ